MSSKITQAQLEANTTTYALKDYREMVNYVSGTNKGYVRFTKADDGKLKLEKFNNKIDVPLSWRSNTSAAHNKAVREKFLNALEHDLKYMGDSANSIRKLVLTPKVPGKDVEDPGKALSRRDLKDIFEKFDAQFNTGSGRTAILKHFMAAAKLECSFDGTDEEFAASPNTSARRRARASRLCPSTSAWSRARRISASFSTASKALWTTPSSVSPSRRRSSPPRPRSPRTAANSA